MQSEIDARVKAMFGGLTVTVPRQPAPSDTTASADQQQQQEEDEETFSFPDMDDAALATVGRDQPKVWMALLEAAQSADKGKWTTFQVSCRPYSLHTVANSQD